jgi:DNA-binding IclR family transcriptional regulator
MTGEEYTVPAVVSAARLLALLADAPRDGVTQAELARAADLSRSSAHNILGTLHQLGYAYRDPGTRRYTLGQELVGLGRAAAAHHTLLDALEDEARSMALEFGIEHAVARRISVDAVQIVYSAPPPTGLHISAMVGTRLDWFTGAVGRCLLAALAPREAERVIRSADLVKSTPSSLTDPEEILARVAEVRSTGYSYAAAEVWDIHAAVAPVFASDGTLELMLMAFGFPSQMPAEQLATEGKRLRAAADRIASENGGRPFSPS